MAARSPNDIIGWIEDIVSRDPSRPSLERECGAALSYAMLLTDVELWASWLIACGVAPGDRVVALIEKSPDAITLYLACLWVGAVFMPLNVDYTAPEIAYFLDDAEPALCVVDTAFQAKMPPGTRVETLDATGRGSLINVAVLGIGPRRRFDGEAPAAMLYTSGTTGKPKGAILSRAALASNALALATAWHFSADDVLLHALPLFHVHGLFVATNTVLAVGASMLLLPRFESDMVLASLPRSTIFMGVPTFYTRLLQHPDRLQEASLNMRLFISGSAPLLAETHQTFQDVTGHAIIERYGMTETLINTTNPHAGDRIAGTVGPALPGVQVRVTDPVGGAPLPDGSIGMIEVKGPNLFSGYWRNPEKTAQDFRPDGYFITGDLGLIDPAGYVQIVGRGKDLIITGGLNVYPKEIETVVNALDGVVECAVIGVPHPDFGEAVVAIVMAEPDADQTGWQSGIDAALAKFKRPKHIEIVTDLPRNTMGKVQKNLLRDRFGDLFVG